MFYGKNSNVEVIYDSADLLFFLLWFCSFVFHGCLAQCINIKEEPEYLMNFIDDWFFNQKSYGFEIEDEYMGDRWRKY